MPLAASQMVLRFGATEPRDDEMVREFLTKGNVAKDELRFDVERRIPVVDMDAVVTRDMLTFNCQCCLVSSAHLGIRPCCPRCHAESVLVTSDVRVRVGRVTWGQLVNCRGECLAAGERECGYRGKVRRGSGGGGAVAR